MLVADAIGALQLAWATQVAATLSLPTQYDGATTVGPDLQPVEVTSETPRLGMVETLFGGTAEVVGLQTFRLGGELTIGVGVPLWDGVGNGEAAMAVAAQALARRDWVSLGLATGGFAPLPAIVVHDRWFLRGRIPWDLWYRSGNADALAAPPAGQTIQGVHQALRKAWSESLAAALPIPTYYENHRPAAEVEDSFAALSILPAGNRLLETWGTGGTEEHGGLLRAQLYAAPRQGLAPILPAIDLALQSFTVLQVGAVTIEPPSIQRVETDDAHLRVDVTARYSALLPTEFSPWAP
jgi:hypothetical protein